MVRTCSLFAILYLLAVQPATAFEFDSFGPALVRNHHPLYTGLLAPAPETAKIADSFDFSFSFNYTNVYMTEKTGGWTVGVDKEIIEAGATLKFPLKAGEIEFGAYIPAYISFGGVFDNLLRWWHRRIGMKGYNGQLEAPDFRYLDIVSLDNEIITEGYANRVYPGSVLFWFKKELLNSESYTVAGQVLVKAPTGDSYAGTGSWDGGARLVISGRWREYLLHSSIGVTVPGKMKGKVDLDPFLTGYFAMEYPVATRWRLLAQSQVNTSPLATLNFEPYSLPFAEITFGVAYRPSPEGRTYIVGISENLTQTAPDFTINFSIR